MAGWMSYSLYEGKVTFLRGKMGDNEICVGFGRGADVSFLEEDYEAVIGPAWSEDDGMYWGTYQKKGFVPDVDYDCPEGLPADDTLFLAPHYKAMPEGSYELDHAFVEGDDSSEPDDYVSGWSELDVTADSVHAPDGWVYECE